MTTSFTTSDQFEPQGGGFGEEGDYPEAFGITFTPNVIGIAAGVGGFLIAAYLVWTQVLPVWNELSELNKQKEEKQGQLEQLDGNQLNTIIAQKNAELKETENLKQDVIKLFASEENLETLLLDVSNFANLSNVKMSSYSPSAEKTTLADDSLGTLAQNNVQVQNFQLQLEGNFSQLQMFLQDLERLQPLLVINNLTANRVGTPQYLFENDRLVSVDEPTLNTTLTVQAVFADVKSPAPSEQPAPNQQTAPNQKPAP